MASIFPSIYNCNSTLCKQFCQNLYKGVKGMLGLYDLAILEIMKLLLRLILFLQVYVYCISVPLCILKSCSLIRNQAKTHRCKMTQ
jgi:hypothetical protein